MRNLASLVFAGGLAFLLLTLLSQLAFGTPPMPVGTEILAVAPGEVGAANLVTAVLLGYRGFDTLGELAMLFAAATAAGVVLGRRRDDARRDPPGGEVLAHRGGFAVPLVGGRRILCDRPRSSDAGRRFSGRRHPGCGLLRRHPGATRARSESWPDRLDRGSGRRRLYPDRDLGLVEDGDFLAPLLGPGVMGELVSAGTLPLLSLAIGLKVGAELAGIMAHIADAEAPDT
jgi:multicomponent Na+:H+ antiporter subunit B